MALPHDTWRDMKEETEIQDPDVGAEDGAEGEAGEGASQEDREGEGVAGEVHELREELETLNDQHLRLAAEFNNYRKRNERDRHALATRLQADLVASLLDVLDDLERVAASGPEAGGEAVLEGVRLVEKKFGSVLETAGLESIDAEGELFDPEVMEALMTVPTDDPERDHRVADVFQRGYRFRDRLLRPARVRVWQYDEASDALADEPRTSE